MKVVTAPIERFFTGRLGGVPLDLAIIIVTGRGKTAIED
jgi:hypothetical protein